MNKLILYVCAWICLHSCGFSKSQEESMLEYALSQAGDNRKELEYVIKYYEGDSLKREAARFLIRNMVYHFGYEKRVSRIFAGIYFPTGGYTNRPPVYVRS